MSLALHAIGQGSAVALMGWSWVVRVVWPIAVST